MKKTIRFTNAGETWYSNNESLTIHCSGKDKHALARAVFLLQFFVVDYFNELFEGARFIEDEMLYEKKKFRGIKDLKDIRCWSIDDGYTERRFIVINGTKLDDIFGITNLCENSPESNFHEGRIVDLKLLKAKDIEKAIGNIQILINHSALKPLKKKSHEKNNQN